MKHRKTERPGFCGGFLGGFCCFFFFLDGFLGGFCFFFLAKCSKNASRALRKLTILQENLPEYSKNEKIKWCVLKGINKIPKEHPTTSHNYLGKNTWEMTNKLKLGFALNPETKINNNPQKKNLKKGLFYKK